MSSEIFVSFRIKIVVLNCFIDIFLNENYCRCFYVICKVEAQWAYFEGAKLKNNTSITFKYAYGPFLPFAIRDPCSKIKTEHSIEPIAMF